MDGQKIQPRSHYCVICQSPLLSGEETKTCPNCSTVFHEECWEYNGGCAVYGCSQVPETEKISDMEIPLAHWGQDHKPCPSCGQDIKAVAMRCKHCGAIFESGNVSRETYEKRNREKTEAPKIKRLAMFLFVLCVIPFTAPFALIPTHLWRRYHGNRLERVLSSQVNAVSQIGIIVALAEVFMFVLCYLLYMLWIG